MQFPEAEFSLRFSREIPITGNVMNLKKEISAMKKTSFIAALAALAMNAALWGQTITVISPAAGNEWARGTTKTISWASSGVTGNVMIKLRPADSTSSVPILTIASNTANNGSFSWAIPVSVPPGTYKVRVRTVAADPSVYDDSENFTIGPEIQTVCQNGNLKWSSELIVTPQAPKLDQVVTFNAKFAVEKCDFIKAAACLYLRLDGSSKTNLVEKKEFAHLAKGVQVPVTFQWRAFRGGKHRVSLVIEESKPLETKTSDNTISAQFDVYAPPADSCDQHASDTADLRVTYFDVASLGNGNYKYTVHVKNDGPRCVKAVMFRVKNLGKTVAEINKVHPSPTGYLMKAGEEIEFWQNFSVVNPSFFPCLDGTGQNCTRFEFIIDPENLIPDNNRANNSSIFTMALIGI